ncbi:MAG TPA: MCE family protein [Pseudonocardiaceae bacterium]|jgi:phospholipid/cholesterol/gamma-HCH transport system substrate-binding protein|nr:MCE family protein [Pseudonocardiaceae bacterium]
MTPIRERNPVTIGVAGIVVLVIVGLFAYFYDDLPLIGGGTTYTADVTESAGLVSGNEVRVAGVKVGTVTGVTLAGDRVRVRFTVKDTWVGDQSTAAIKIKTLLGEKYLAVDPLGPAAQHPDQDIPVNRTVSPYDVTEAFNGLADTVGQIDTKQLANSFEAISQTFGDSAPDVHQALTGLAALSTTIASRDDELAELLANTRKLTGILAQDDSEFEALLKDGNQLLGELQARRDAIAALLTGTRDLSRQLSGVVADNTAQLTPTLRELGQVADILQRNQANLDHALALAGPYYRLVGNTLGNGRWMDAYLCGLIPPNYLPPGTAPDTGCQPSRTAGGN